jgi:hypothetical protein
MSNKLTVIIALIAIVAVMTTGVIIMGLQTVYAKKHHHLTDTEKEDSTASDSNGNACTFGEHHDQCAAEFFGPDSLQFKQSQDKTCHFGPNHDECFKEAWENDS